MCFDVTFVTSSGGGFLSVRKEKKPSVLAHEKASFSGVSFVGGDGFAPITTDNSNMIFSALQGEIDTKFTPKKEQTIILSDVYEAIDLKSRSSRVSSCGSFLEFHVSDSEKKLHQANFCRDRLCPMCNWRRSLKIFGQVSRVMDVLEADGYRFLFLTLTVRSCSADELPETVQILFDGWRFLYHKHKRVKQSVCGSFRSLEVTRNSRTGLFHPHLHVILAVKPDYFSGRKYISQAEWGQIWRSSCSLDYDPIIDIRTIKPNSKGISGAVAEVSKYAVKSTDFLHGSMNDKISFVSAFLSALTGRRLCSFTGVFSKVRRDLNLDDVETGDLVNVDGSELRPDVSYLVVRYSWRSGVYVSL